MKQKKKIYIEVSYEEGEFNGVSLIDALYTASFAVVSGDHNFTVVNGERQWSPARAVPRKPAGGVW